MAERGDEMNFASTFPGRDIMLGNVLMPAKPAS